MPSPQRSWSVPSPYRNASYLWKISIQHERERGFTIRRLVFFSRGCMHQQQAGSNVDLIGPGRKPEHRDAFANQCHHEIHTHTHLYIHTETGLHTVILRVWRSSEMICVALGFTAWYYQSCQAGRSAVQENVAWVENRHTVRMTVWRGDSMCVLLRYNKEKQFGAFTFIWHNKVSFMMGDVITPFTLASLYPGLTNTCLKSKSRFWFLTGANVYHIVYSDVYLQAFNFGVV